MAKAVSKRGCTTMIFCEIRANLQELCVDFPQIFIFWWVCISIAELFRYSRELTSLFHSKDVSSEELTSPTRLHLQNSKKIMNSGKQKTQANPSKMMRRLKFSQFQPHTRQPSVSASIPNNRLKKLVLNLDFLIEKPKNKTRCNKQRIKSIIQRPLLAPSFPPISSLPFLFSYLLTLAIKLKKQPFFIF